MQKGMRNVATIKKGHSRDKLSVFRYGKPVAGFENIPLDGPRRSWWVQKNMYGKIVHQMAFRGRQNKVVMLQIMSTSVE